MDRARLKGSLHTPSVSDTTRRDTAGKTRTGRLWVYARDDRACGDDAAPAALYCYTPDRKGEHPQRQLAGWRGTLQADGYAGFNALYEARGGDPPEIIEVACWAHVRRKFFDIHQAHKGAAANEVLERIGRLYAVEERVRGQPAARRATARQAEAALEITALRTQLDQLLRQVPGKSTLAEAIRYALSRWPALTRYLADGRLEIDNNIAERAMRAVALGPQELAVRRLGRRGRSRRGVLHPHRNRQEQRPQPAPLAHPCPGGHRA